jgi:hypothetical protein
MKNPILDEWGNIHDGKIDRDHYQIPFTQSFDAIIHLIQQQPMKIRRQVGARVTGGDQFAYRIFEFITPLECCEALLRELNLWHD